MSIEKENINFKNFVVYPGYGVAEVKREIIKEINDSKIIFLELKFLNKDVTILIPKNGLESVGVRRLCGKKEIEEILKNFFVLLNEEWLKNICLISWNRRSKEYQSRIRTGNLQEIAIIFRDLKYIALKKGLSFGEKTVLSQVEFLLAEEISVVSEKILDETISELRRFFDYNYECVNKAENEFEKNFHFLSFMNLNNKNKYENIY